MNYSSKWQLQSKPQDSTNSGEVKNRVRVLLPENGRGDPHAQRPEIAGSPAVQHPDVTTALVEDCARLYFEVGHEKANFAALLQVVLLVADRLGIPEIDSPDRPGL